MLPILLASLAVAQAAPVGEGDAANGSPEAVAFVISTRKPEDQVKVRLEGGNATFDVLSRSGIGSATIMRPKDKWPVNVILRFHLRGLESLAISNGKLKLEGSVLSHGGYTKRLHVTEDGRGEEREPRTTIEVLDFEGRPIAGLPDKGGYFLIAVPKALLESQPKSLELQWIDFYR